MKFISKSEKETKKIAADLAKQLRGGEVILMYGDLGAGKTVFVKGLAKALGIAETIKSPTFNIMKVYKSQIPNPKSQINSKSKIQNTKYQIPNTGFLCHIDAYRLKNFDDLLDIGADEYLGKENVISVVEWAERIDEKLRITNYELRIIRVKIQHGKEENERMIEIEK